MKVFISIISSIGLLWSLQSLADPSVVSTQVLGPFVGADARFDPANVSPYQIAFYGTDLGFSYAFDGKLQFLFGDSWATEAYAPIEKSTGARNDDSFGSINLSDWPDPSRITPDNIPTVRLGQHSGSPEAMAIDPGYAMDLGKTPEAGFTNGIREFGIFLLGKPLGCSTNSECGKGLSCDQGLGYAGPKYTDEMGFTAACMEGEPGCNADTMVDTGGKATTGSGFCTDRSSSVWDDSPAGRVAAVALTQRVGVRSTSDPRKYAPIRDWLTTKFLNTTVSTVQSFDPGHSGGYKGQDYRTAGPNGTKRRVFLWGRPGFIGVAATGHSLGLYFAYVDMPRGPHFAWKVHYFTGLRNGVPQFSDDEADAAALDLDSTRDGNQPGEVHDVVDQMSVAWVDHLKKWVMFYGGGMGKLTSPALPHCGILEAFARSECTKVVVGDGAFRMRTADYPWGPWSPPQDLIAGGDPDVPGSGQYGPGGVLHHPDCTAPTCAPHTQTPFYHKNEYGFFYAADIIESWIRPAGKGVDIIWNASTWDPYRVVLLRTRINP